MSETRAQRATTARLEKERVHVRKVEVIGDRRAKALNLSKTQFVAGVIQGKYRPITAEDIDAEPNPQD